MHSFAFRTHSTNKSYVPEQEILNVNGPSNTKLASGETSSRRQQKWPLQWGYTFTITFTGLNLVRELSWRVNSRNSCTLTLQTQFALCP